MNSEIKFRDTHWTARVNRSISWSNTRLLYRPPLPPHLRLGLGSLSQYEKARAIHMISREALVRKTCGQTESPRLSLGLIKGWLWEHIQCCDYACRAYSPQRGLRFRRKSGGTGHSSQRPWPVWPCQKGSKCFCADERLYGIVDNPVVPCTWEAGEDSYHIP